MEKNSNLESSNYSDFIATSQLERSIYPILGPTSIAATSPQKSVENSTQISTPSFPGPELSTPTSNPPQMKESTSLVFEGNVKNFHIF